MPDAESTTRLLDALELRHHAKVGFGVGILIAVVMYVYRVAALAGPVPSTRGSPALYLLLAFVLAISAGALVTIALTVRTAIRLTRTFE